MMGLLGRREIIAYLFSATMCFLIGYTIVVNRPIEALTMGFVAMATTIIGFYFGKRAGEEAEKKEETKP